MLCPSSPISHSRSFDHRLLARLPLTAMASAFRCPSGEHLPLPEEDYEAFAARHSRVDQVPPQRRVMLGAERDHDGWVFRTLALVDRRCVRKHQFVEFAKPLGDLAAVELGAERAFLYVGAADETEIA